MKTSIDLLISSHSIDSSYIINYAPCWRVTKPPTDTCTIDWSLAVPLVQPSRPRASSAIAPKQSNADATKSVWTIMSRQSVRQDVIAPLEPDWFTGIEVRMPRSARPLHRSWPQTRCRASHQVPHSSRRSPRTPEDPTRIGRQHHLCKRPNTACRD